MAKVSHRPLKSPFPYPGGKSSVAHLVWERFGNVDNYLEPFMGTLAVLLRRPAEHFVDRYRVETVNDRSHFIVNFWRAVAADPDSVAMHADRPVTEADLHASHRWLVQSASAAEFRSRMVSDPFYFDAKIAGYWVHGQCCWIGAGWCADEIGRWENQKQSLHPGNGVHSRGRPQLADAFDIGRGVNGGASKKMPRIGHGSNVGNAVAGAHVNGDHTGGLFEGGFSGTCDARRAWLVSWMRRLADRLRLVRTCYGHWSRICDSESTLTRLGLTGVMLDPPYPIRRADTGKKSRAKNLYATDKGADLDKLRDEVLAWCQRWGQDEQVRVALCCYEGDGYEALEREGWSVEAWSASGGYGNQSGGKKSENADRERIWFSPACRREATLFDGF